MRSISMLADGRGTCFSLVHLEAHKPIRLTLVIGPRLLDPVLRIEAATAFCFQPTAL